MVASSRADLSTGRRVAAIHQPNFLPWLGFFHKMAVADVFILLDSVPFTKNSFQDIFVGEAEPMKANLINIRAPFHDGTLRFYQQKISRLSNFVAMLSASVVLLERLTTLCRSRDMEPA